MNQKRKQLFRTALLAGAVALTVPQAALALTDACTPISNIAHVDYEVDGVPQKPDGTTLGKDSNTKLFYVGVKVDLQVTRKNATIVTVAPGRTNAALTFNVANLGNATMKYALTTTPLAGVANPYALPVGLTDTFNGTIVSTNGTAGATGSIASLAPNPAGQDVVVLVDIPFTVSNNDLAAYALTAQSQFPGTGGGDVTTKNSTATGTQIGGAICTADNAVKAATIDVVAADAAGTDDPVGANDGAHSVREAFLVSAAGLTITKSSTVYYDPYNGLYPNAKAIPGAVVTYTVEIKNAAGGADATNVKVIDDLSTMMASSTVFGNSQTVSNSYKDQDGTTCPTGSAYGIVVDGVCKTNANDGDGTSWNQAGDPNGGLNKIAATIASVPAGATKTVKYQVTIQ